MNMEKGFLYQQDTVKGTNPLDNLPGLPEPGGLNIERSAAVPMPIPMSSERVIQKEELTEVREKPAPLSNAQLRYRWWQNEKKLLVFLLIFAHFCSFLLIFCSFFAHFCSLLLIFCSFLLIFAHFCSFLLT